MRDTDGSWIELEQGYPVSEHGSVVVIERDNDGYKWVDMYVCVIGSTSVGDHDNYGEFNSEEELQQYIDEISSTPSGALISQWKKVDLDWPKIDPDTGLPYDQYKDWHSPLAQ